MHLTRPTVHLRYELCRGLGSWGLVGGSILEAKSPLSLPVDRWGHLRVSSVHKLPPPPTLLYLLNGPTRASALRHRRLKGLQSVPSKEDKGGGISAQTQQTTGCFHPTLCKRQAVGGPRQEGPACRKLGPLAPIVFLLDPSPGKEAGLISRKREEAPVGSGPQNAAVGGVGERTVCPAQPSKGPVSSTAPPPPGCPRRGKPGQLQRRRAQAGPPGRGAEEASSRAAAMAEGFRGNP